MATDQPIIEKQRGGVKKAKAKRKAARFSHVQPAVARPFLGYNTNGLAHHDLFDAVELLAEIGYRGVGITIDHNALTPESPRHRKEITRLRWLLERLQMRSVIETGARYLLDPRRKHEPTLLSEDRRHRIALYKYAIDCAAELQSDCVSIWSGALATAPVFDPKSLFLPGNQLPVTMGLSPWDAPMDWLMAGLDDVLDYAAEKDVAIGFEPEPGMFIDTMQAYEELLARMGDDRLRLTLDIGHLHCQGETPIADMIQRWAPRLVNVHLEDMCAGRHEHLMFGEGEIQFPPVLQALSQSGYTGGIYVELSRHSHEGPAAARRAFEYLQDVMKDVTK